MKILICVMGKLRNTEITWPSFKKYVIDELGADLVTCGSDYNLQNQFTKNAIHNFPSDAIINSEVGHNGEAVVIHRHNLWKCVPKNYDQYILTRSDQMWYGPHPRLDNDHVWFMNCEFHLGISDRHTVIPLNNLYNLTVGLGKWVQITFNNIESFLYERLHQQGMWGPRIGLGYFPMFLCDAEGNPRISVELGAPKVYVTWPFQIDHYYETDDARVCGKLILDTG